MSNPLVNLQQLRKSVAAMPDDQKKRVNGARKAIEAMFEEFGDEANIAILEAALKGAVERGDV